MTDNKPSAEGLVTVTMTAPATTAAATPPVAIADPDPAAQLDPAKAPPPPKAAGKKKRRRRPAKAQIAKPAKAAGSDARAAYAAAELALVGNYAELPENAPLHLRFANGEEFVTDGIEVPRDHLGVDGNRATYMRPADFVPEGPPALVSEAWLIAESGEAVCCQVGVGMATGGGRHALIPAGHLLF